VVDLIYGSVKGEMRYYCNICKKDITKAEFLYSIDKFDRALCREHQQLESKIQESKIQPSLESNIKSQTKPIEKIESEKSQSKIGSLLKRAVVATGKGIVKGAKKLADSTRKTMQIRHWKDDILRRMSMSQLKRLCFEKRIGIKKSVLKEDRSGGFYWKEYNCSKADLVSRIKNRVDLEYIIGFAKRNHIRIRDILTDIERKKQEWRIKQIDETMQESGMDLLLELEKSIREFKPLRRYYQEILYQDSLASWLKSKFSDTDIEIQRGSSRPDIVVNDVAIEIKGPTSQRDLDSVPSKCMRYSQYFNDRVIIVLFDVQVSQSYYEEWKRGLEKTHPNAIVIRK
jgi:hypothetical protein